MDRMQLVAPCGVNCGNCGLLEENITEDIRARLAEFRSITPDDAVCKGCRSEQGNCVYIGDTCATWACAEKIGVTYCFECGEFPCVKLLPSAKGAHRGHNIKLYNLCRMQRNGIEAWMDESAQIQKLYFEGELVVGQGPVLEDE